MVQGEVFLLGSKALTHFTPLVSFYTLGKHQKTSGAPMFSGDIEREVA